MTALRKKSSPRPTSLSSACRTRGSSPCAGQCAHQRRADELALFLVERRNEIGNHRAIGMVLEKAVRDRAQTIVGAGARLAHRVLRARIVEAGEDDERAIADVAVRMLGDGLQQRRHRLRRRRSGGPCVPRRYGRRNRSRRACRWRLSAVRRRRSGERPVPVRLLARRRRGHRREQQTSTKNSSRESARRRMLGSVRHRLFVHRSGSPCRASTRAAGTSPDPAETAPDRRPCSTSCNTSCAGCRPRSSTLRGSDSRRCRRRGTW